MGFSVPSLLSRITAPLLGSVVRPLGAHGEGVGGWTPAALGASLLGWWSADRADLISLSGSQVTSWLDIVAGYNMAQGVSSARPIYSASSFNGSPGVTFDGVDDELTLASQPFPSGASQSELWATAQQGALVADASSRILFSYGGIATNNRRTLTRIVTTGVNRARGSSGNGTSEFTANDTAVDFSSRHVLRNAISGTAAALTIDGGTPTSVAVVSNTATTRARIGANCADTAAGFWSGPVRDIIVTGALTSEQAALLQTYLLNRRAL